MLPLKDENPTRYFPVITLTIIVANCWLFLESQLGNPQEYRLLIVNYGVIPHELFRNPFSEFLTLFSAMFVHSGWGHLFGNMLYLWIFGNNIEDSLGKVSFILFYSVCGVIASVSHILLDLQSEIPMVGASGAISGVLGAYLMLFPRAKVLTLVFLGIIITFIRIPAVILLTLWILLQIGNSLIAGPEAGGVAWSAHIAGFIAGMTLIHPFRNMLGDRRMKMR